MKLKLLIIGVLILLLCAAVPVAGTTAPTTVTKKVYTLNVVNDEWFLGRPTGTMTLNPTTGEYSVSLSKLQPGVTYTLGISVASPTTNGQVDGYGWIVKGVISTDGSFSATGKMDRTLDLYHQGGVFIVTPSTKGEHLH